MLSLSVERFQQVVKPMGILLLVLLFLTSATDSALAARSSGRIGGSQFSAPRSAPAPRSYSYGGGGSGSFYSPFPVFPIVPLGGFYSPSLIAPFGFGSFIMFALFVSTILPRLRNRLSEDTDNVNDDDDAFNPAITICELKIALLASGGRYLQQELETLAMQADTGSKEGLFFVLNETVLALLRHPEYWCYASINKSSKKWSQATSEFNRKSIEARSQTKTETVSNFNNSRRRRDSTTNESSAFPQAPSEYILVDLILAAEGKISGLPMHLNNEADVKQTLKAISGTSSERLQGLEVIWVPQETNDSLTEEEMLLQHAELQRIT
eukprot:jgi/Galph1/4059/GphlegSOOS_G2776.1